MKEPGNILKEKALGALHRATCNAGILALPIQHSEVENYTRIWARDSIMAGLVGLDYEDATLITGLKNSLNTLKDNQTKHGIIPSNVSVGEPARVSYGGTAGRVDATLWYIIGALKYMAHTNDFTFRRSHIWHVEKAIEVALIWEFNNKHLLYTPLSGNWADEYPVHGYTLYDNCLRLWGLELYAEHIGSSKSFLQKAAQIRKSIKSNFFLNMKKETTKYHALLYDRTISKGTKPYFVTGFNPSRYFTMFDAGGNGLALMLGLMNKDSITEFINYLEGIFSEINIDLMPAFWPVIDEKDPLFSDLNANYAYSFKNVPHHFHNGGIWPIMNGWLAKGLYKYGAKEIINKMKNAYLNVAKNENYKFSEYIASDTLKPGGKTPLSYSATGALMILNPKIKLWSETN